jgi:hypothetical protein
MAIVLNAPKPRVPPPAPEIAGRTWLEGADQSIRSIRFLCILMALCVAALGAAGAETTKGVSLVLLPVAIGWVMTNEILFIIARACVATAWAARKPDPAPDPPRITVVPRD